MSTTTDRFKTRRRAVHTVDVDGGDPLYVRHVTLAEMREIDRRAEALSPGVERELRRITLTALYAFAGDDGAPLFPNRSDEDLDAVEQLTPAELRAAVDASVPDKDAAKNG